MVSVLVSVADALPLKPLLHSQFGLEARVGIEPTMQLLQSRALPLGYPATGTIKLNLFRNRIKLTFKLNYCFNWKILIRCAVSKVPSN
jgi:hypothetical protein